MDVKTLCLGVLMLGDASGYEIKKHFEDGPFAHFHAAGFGSIYPALNALLSDGLVTCKIQSQSGRPDKKIYAITDAGRQMFRRAIHKPPAPDTFRSETLFMLFFSDLLEPTHRRAVYDRYLELHRDHLARMDAEIGCHSCAEPEGESAAAQREARLFVHGLGHAVYQAVVAYMERHRGAMIDPTAAKPTSMTRSGDGAGFALRADVAK